MCRYWLLRSHVKLVNTMTNIDHFIALLTVVNI